MSATESASYRMTYEEFVAAHRAAKRRRGRLRRWFADRKVRTKILVALGVVTALSMVTTVVAVGEMARMTSAANAMYAGNLQPLIALGHVHQEEIKTRQMVFGAAISQVPSELQSYLDKVKQSDADLDAALASYRSFHPAGEKLRLLADFTQAWSDFRTLRDAKMLPFAKTGALASFNTAQEIEAQPLIDKAADSLDKLEQLESSEAAAHDASIRHEGSRALVTLLIVLLAGLACALLLATAVSRAISRPLREVVRVLRAVAGGDLTARADVESADEIGEMVRALDDATGSLRTVLGAVQGSSVSLASASDELSGVSGQIAASAQESSAQAGVVAAAAEQVSRNVQTVAAGAEQMSASIAEIAQNAHEAARVGTDAVAAAEATNVTVAQLGESSQEIGDVIKVITMIAEQTSMLALNATIEAARAGEAGKGFAVVANEVKDLAEKTAKATENIGARVAKIQTDAVGAAEAIAQIGSIVDRINEYQITIASAVEQQNNTTNEMNRNVTEAALGSSEIAGNIAGVATAADETTAGVTRAEESARELARMSGDLRELLAQFTF